MGHKSDATDLVEQFLADTRADGVTSEMVSVWPERGGEFRRGNFGDLY